MEDKSPKKLRTAKSDAERQDVKRFREATGEEVTNPVSLGPDALGLVDSLYPENMELEGTERKRALSIATAEVMRQIGEAHEIAEQDAAAIDYEIVARQLKADRLG